MKNQMHRLLNALLALIIVAGMAVSNAPVTAEKTPPEPLQLLASAREVQAENLTLLNMTTFTLLDGRQVQRIKAWDASAGQPLGGDFMNGKEVILADLQAEAGGTWRQQHGALTPATVYQLSRFAPTDPVNIAIWLAGDIEALPHEEKLSGGTEKDYETALTPAPDAQDRQLHETIRLGDKDFLVPLANDQIPDFVRAATLPGMDSPPDSHRTEAEQAASMQANMAAIPAADADGQIEAFKQANQRHLEAQVAPLQAAFAAHLATEGLKPTYASPLMPSVVLENVPRSLVEEMAFWPEIDAIYIVPDHAGPSVNTARPAQNANLVNDVGYIGTGVAVAVLEGERAFFANPTLVLRNAYDGTQPYANHPTAVAGFIKSTASGYYGLANGATVDSANGSYSNWATMTAAMDWAAANNTVINNSWYWDYPDSPTFWEADRRLDYIVRYLYDYVTVAAGNFGNGCGGNFSSYVVSPAKGYNVMAVGNHEDQDNTNWTDDAMDVCSSFGNPGSDTADPTREKPEVSAIGATLDSTLTTTTDPLVGPVGSGTSYAAPMVASLAADMIQADPALAAKPEALRALIMATALQNVEGTARLSDKDGVGAVDFTAALASAERGHYTSQYVSSSSTFPISFTQYVHKGERVRFVITWLSNPDGTYTSDPLPADLDLYAYRADGSTLMGASTSSSNNFEIVDFIAPESETYQFRVNKFTFTGAGTWLGTGRWRGEYRISPFIQYTDPKASPLGTHLAIDPTEWARPNYWRVLGIRSTSSDHDLYFYTASLFANPNTRTFLNGSFNANSIDVVAVDGNHRSSALFDHYVIRNYSGSGGYNVNWSNNNFTLTAGTYGPFTPASPLPADIYDLYLKPGVWRILVVPNNPTNTSDISVHLFASSASNPDSWVQGSWQAARYSNTSSSPATTEGFFFRAPAADYYGLVISSVSSSTTLSYYIKIESLIFLPSIIR